MFKPAICLIQGYRVHNVKGNPGNDLRPSLPSFSHLKLASQDMWWGKSCNIHFKEYGPFELHIVDHLEDFSAAIFTLLRLADDRAMRDR